MRVGRWFYWIGITWLCGCGQAGPLYLPERTVPSQSVQASNDSVSL